MSVNCGFLKGCTNPVTHQVKLNKKLTYICTEDMNKILNSGLTAESLQSVERVVKEVNKHVLISLLLNSYEVLTSHKQTMLENNSKLITGILNEQQRAVDEIDKVSRDIIDLIAKINSYVSFKTYEKVPSLFELLLDENPENIQSSYERFKLFEVNPNNINGITTAGVKNDIKLFATNYVPPADGKCYKDHFLFVANDLDQFYGFLMSGNNAQISCEECANHLNTSSYHCRICNFDMCEKCCEKKNFILRKPPLCLNNHETVFLKNNENPPLVFVCSSCKKKTKKHRWTCQSCNFIICELCAKINFIQPLFEYPFMCQNNHRMICFYEDDRYTCSQCSITERDVEAWKCEDCRIRICKQCALFFGHKTPQCSKGHNMVHYTARRKFKLFRSSDCVNCNKKTDDFGFACRECESNLCEVCFLTSPLHARA
jgi:hypothetical protein